MRVKRKRAYEKTEGQKDKALNQRGERKRERTEKREGKREGKKEAEGQRKRERERKRKRKRKAAYAYTHAVTQRSSADVVSMLCLPPSPYMPCNGRGGRGGLERRHGQQCRGAGRVANGV